MRGKVIYICKCVRVAALPTPAPAPPPSPLADMQQEKLICRIWGKCFTLQQQANGKLWVFGGFTWAGAQISFTISVPPQAIDLPI